MKNVFNSKDTICRANKPSFEPTREQITGAMENYLKSGGSIERINGPHGWRLQTERFLKLLGRFRQHS